MKTNYHSLSLEIIHESGYGLKHRIDSFENAKSIIKQARRLTSDHPIDFYSNIISDITSKLENTESFKPFQDSIVSYCKWEITKNENWFLKNDYTNLKWTVGIVVALAAVLIKTGISK